MNISGDHKIASSRERIFGLLTDPETLAQILPGCEELTAVSDSVFSGTIGAKVGPIDGTYKTTFTILEQIEPELFRIGIDGKGPTGMVSGNIKIDLAAGEDGITTVTYDGDAQVSGRIARVGQRLMKAAAGMMARRGFSELEKIAEDRETADPA